MKCLVTGCAGFIGFHLAARLLRRGDTVIGLDNVNSYYDVALKQARLARLEAVAAETGATYRFHRADLADRVALARCFAEGGLERVIHLAAQAGVRHSLEHPESYVSSNLVGFANLLEACRDARTPHLTFASTSSVYGANEKLPFSEHDCASHPLQLYAATKRANELMAHSYAHLFAIPMTGLRFFTVYGPWGRPDMALFKFTKAILAGQSIPVFNQGRSSRDFTYVDDVVTAIVLASDDIAAPNPDWVGEAPDPATSLAPFRIFNVGNSQPVTVLDYIAAIEAALGRKADLDLMPMQPGDVAHTASDTGELERRYGFRPATPVEDGVRAFVAWYLDYYRGSGDSPFERG